MISTRTSQNQDHLSFLGAHFLLSQDGSQKNMGKGLDQTNLFLNHVGHTEVWDQYLACLSLFS